MADFALVGDSEKGTTIVLSGPLRVSSIGDLDRRLGQIDQPVARVDLSQVTDIDTAGAWLAWSFARERDAELAGVSDKAGRLIKAVSVAGIREADEPDHPNLFERTAAGTGRLISAGLQGSVMVIGFLGSLLIAMGSVIRHPSRFSGRATVRQMELVGVSALGIIGLMSFLVGIVIASQGADNLAEYGAETLTVNLTGRIAMRELGILMTAIMVAGRSGSAFAAQIGTMKLTEEIDAMRTIGVSPMEALVIPRVVAAMLMMPLLGFYAAVVAIIGGAFISSFQIDIPFYTFISRIREVVPIHDLWVGMIKAPVFGLIIAVAGCYNGMQVRGNAEEVGLRTTEAVVAAIFMVIVLDAFFAVFFSQVGWG